MDIKEQDYWRTKWKEATNTVSVMQVLLQTQAIQIGELKTKLRECSKQNIVKSSEIEQLSRCVTSLRDKHRDALGRRNAARRKAA